MTFASYLVRFVPDGEKINAEYLAAFLSCKYGIMELRRRSRPSINQTNINPEEVKKIEIPLLNTTLQRNIAKQFQIAHKLRLQATARYSVAETNLLSALGMDSFTPSQEPIAVKLFSESFGASGRLDAEYYQRKYEDVLQRLSDLRCKKLGDIVSIMKSIEPGSDYYSDEGVPFVRVSDITKFGIQQPKIRIPANLAQPYLYPKRNTILLSKDGSVGITYKVEDDLTCITSSALLHLIVERDVLPDYLTLILNSIIVQFQAERDAGGSIIQHWKPSKIEEVIIPILGDDIQQRIADDIQYSFALRRQSEQLLETAKRAVEIAIENGEDKAAEFIKVNTG